MGSFIDISGQRFGKLLVVDLDRRRIEERKKSGKKQILYWNCICDCGNKKSIDSYTIRTGQSQSCGCYGIEQRRKSTTIHGLSKGRLKRIYYNMRSRCLNPNTPKFHNYGGRGITICDEWMSGLQVFVEWALNNGYDEKLTLDRIDPDGNYEPSNCRWVDIKTQNYNKRDNRLFEINGDAKTAEEWCNDYGINRNTFWERDFNGFSGEDLIYKGNLKYKNKGE